MIANFKNLVRTFHNDEEGLESLQVVMIIAIAGMVMVAAATLGQEVVDWMKEKWESLQGTDIS